MAQIADVLITSGLLPAHIKTPQAALAIMLKARELGVPTMHGLSTIVVVQGKPTCNGELMLALIYRDQGDEAIVITETTAERCTISYKRRGWTERQTYSFTMEDARRAGLAGGQTWQKYPAAMLRARCISAVARMAFPDSIAGMYGYEEMGVSVDVEDGQVVVAQSAAEPEVAANGHSPDATVHAGEGLAPARTRPASVTRAAAPTVTASVPQTAPAPNAAEHTPPADEQEWPRSAADWSGDQLRQRIEEGAGTELKTGKDWKALARAHAVPEPASAAELGSRTWLLGLYQAMRAAEYAEMIAMCTSDEQVMHLLSEALGERDRRQITLAAYGDLSQAGEARKAELSAPLLSGPRAQVAS